MTKKTGVLIGVSLASAALLAKKLQRPAPAQSLRGEVALITGGSRGLGLALAREFGSHGCRIAICARDADELRRAVADLEGRGIPAFAVPCDVRNEDEVKQMIEAVTVHYGGIDILVNNAGVIDVGPIQSFKVQDFEDSMNTIFWGTLYPTLAALPAFLNRQSGRIVNISSIGGKVGVPHLLPYTSAKFAVAGLSQGLAAELRPQGVSVTTIYPGLLRTGSFVQARFKGRQQQEADWFTLGATVPGASMNTDRAARQIVEAVRSGETESVLSLPAKVIAKVNQAFPDATNRLLSAITASILPGPSRNGTKRRGGDLWPSMNLVVRTLATLGVRAMHNYNQKA